MRKLNLETIIDTLSWYRILPLNGFSLIRVKQQLLTGDGKEIGKVPRAVEETRSYIHRQLLSIWKILCGIIMESQDIWKRTPGCAFLYLPHPWLCRATSAGISNLRSFVNEYLHLYPR